MSNMLCGLNYNKTRIKKSSTLFKKCFKFNFLTGFTLVELLCVVMIISFLFGLSIPIISQTARNFYFRNKAKQIQALCKFIKKTSITGNNTYKLIINFPNNSYTVLQANSEQITGFKKVDDSIFRAMQLPTSLSFHPINTWQDELEIIFEPSGALTSSEFTLEDEKQNIAKFTTSVSGEIILEFI